MLIKIKQPGWDKYTGELGMANFVDGVSTSHISQREAYSLGGMINVVEIDENGVEGNPVSHAFDMAQQRDVSAPVVAPRKRLSEVFEEEAAARALEAAMPDAPAKAYTRAELEAVAEELGITGIRAIAEPMGVRATAIKTLISEILLRQGGS